MGAATSTRRGLREQISRVGLFLCFAAWFFMALVISEYTLSDSHFLLLISAMAILYTVTGVSIFYPNIQRTLS
jgi:hypothetical protein